MEIIDSIDEMQNYALSVKRQGKKVGFVPTMGCLHDGHLSLIHLIRDQADIVILSILLIQNNLVKMKILKNIKKDG